MKQPLRRQILAARDLLSQEERREKSLRIENLLFELAEFKCACTVMFYASFRSEVETEHMIRRALAEGKRVILPKVEGKTLSLLEIHDFDKDVSSGAWGIPEPQRGKHIDLEEVDLVIMPGAVFDELGNRLGYGAGYYDKLLSKGGKTTIALAFEVQIVPKVPRGVHDIPVRKIVTERRIIKTAGNQNADLSN